MIRKFSRIRKDFYVFLIVYVVARYVIEAEIQNLSGFIILVVFGHVR